MQQLKTFETDSIQFEVIVKEDKDHKVTRTVTINGSPIDDYTIQNLIKWLRTEVLGETGQEVKYAKNGPHIESSNHLGGVQQFPALEGVEDFQKNHLNIPIPVMGGDFDNRQAVSLTPLKKVTLDNRKAANPALSDHVRASETVEFVDMEPF